MAIGEEKECPEIRCERCSVVLDEQMTKVEVDDGDVLCAVCANHLYGIPLR